VARLRYLYSQGVKENLVACPDQWPGASSVSVRLRGYDTIEGDWIDRSAMHRVPAGRPRRERDFRSAESVELSPLPAWAHLSRIEYREHVRQLVADIRHEARARCELQGTRPLGIEAVISIDPWSRPADSKRTPAPRFHAATRRVYLQMRRSYVRFLEVYREASRRFREGELGVRFPAGCFPPAPAFTPD
jgi:hypothetical protein